MIKQLKTKQNLGVPSLAHYFHQLCEAIDYMHKLRVIHGDLKPQQVLVTPSGDIKVIDFGCAAREGE
jgi:serine/threonine protein kinase